MAASAPRSERIHIGAFGRTNAGKSSLVNLIAGQAASIVSDVPGTTADPVMKAMEIPGTGPVVLVDTAGEGEAGELGELRAARAREMIARADVGIVALDASLDCEPRVEAEIVSELRRRGAAAIVAVTKADLASSEQVARRAARLCALVSGDLPVVPVSAVSGLGREELICEISRAARASRGDEISCTEGLFDPGADIVLVAPQDAEAPRGRLIMPQVMTIRDILDHGGTAHVCEPSRLERTLASLREPPDLVITDSQAFKAVASIVPSDVPLTSFSILMARLKGDLKTLVRGAKKISSLAPGDRVLIAEACAHHAIADDIARVKLPRALRARAGEGLDIVVASGPSALALEGCALVIHCGGCTFTRRQMIARMDDAREAGVPVTNFGLALAECAGILDRSLEIFRSRTRELE